MDQTATTNDTPITTEIPLSAPTQRASVDTVAVHQEQDALRTSKIMIIDDEQLVIRVVRRFLSSDGYDNFITVTDPREAL